MQAPCRRNDATPPRPRHSPAGIEPAPPPGYIAGMTDVLTAPGLLPILMPPQAILRAKARPVSPADADQIRALTPRMLATMYAAPGIGLAAPQIGVGLRLAVIDLMPDEKPAPIHLINPEIVRVSEELAQREEGCLSLPGQYADVIRPARVIVRFHDLMGARQELEADGLLAACLQHEIDHLNGVLFVDHLSALKRNMILRRLAKEQKQKAAGG
jgi:peptide deformylase